MAGGSTDRGRVRPRNEDSYLASVEPGPEPLALCIVADGMGGANAGQIASQMAVGVVRDQVELWARRALGCGQGREEMDDEAPEALAQAVLAANRRIYDASRDDPGREGMGTTITAALVIGGRLNLAHVGDSRGFLIRDGRIEQLTVDHSVVAELVRCGSLSEEEAAVHPHRNVLTRALGTDPSLAVDLLQVVLRRGDQVLLCSDGVTRHLEPEDMRRVVAGSPPQRAADELVRLALDRGGLDNLTAVVVGYREEPA